MASPRVYPDIMYEILSRASSETLGRCRVASKEWNQTTNDSKFKKLHSQRTNEIDGFVVRDLIRGQDVTSFASIGDETKEISLDFLPGFSVRLKAVSSNYGIILCTSENPRRYGVPLFFVCQPHSKLFQQLPNPRTKFFEEKLAISVVCSNPFRYKILRISSTKKTYVNKYQSLICEIFDSKTWKWTRLTDIRLPQNVWIRRYEPVISVCGAFHCLMSTNLIFSFDLEKEEWKLIRIPVREDEYKYVNTVEYEGKLALICMDMEGYMHTWVLESYRNHVWKKIFVLNMRDPESNHLNFDPMAFYGSDIIVVRGFWSLKYYDFKKGKFLNEAKLSKHHVPEIIFPFWSDSEPCCLRPTSESEFQCSSRKRKKSMTKQLIQ